MALFRRQSVDFEIYDDQSPALSGSFEGNWTRRHYDGTNNNTFTSTSTPGASLSFTFSGSRVWLYGGILNIKNADGGYISYPTAVYKIDGVSAGFQQPVIDTIQNKFVYFQTTDLPDRTHTIDITVTTANETNPFIFDYFRIVPSAGGGFSTVETSRSVPSSTSGVETSLSTPSSASTSTSLPIVTTRSVPIGAIVGGVVGGIACIVILALALLWFFLRKRSHDGQAYYFERCGQACYFEKPTPADILAGEGRIDPFNITATTLASSSVAFSGLDPQPAHPDSPSSLSFGRAVTSQDPSQHSQSGSSETVLTYVSGNSAQPRVGKASLIALQNLDAPRPARHRDSGIRFNENGEQEVGPSRSTNGVPPTYTPD